MLPVRLPAASAGEAAWMMVSSAWRCMEGAGSPKSVLRACSPCCAAKRRACAAMGWTARTNSKGDRGLPWKTPPAWTGKRAVCQH